MATDNHGPFDVEVTLAVDLPVGPRGGVKKADETVWLPSSEAALLVSLGQARYEKKASTAVVEAPQSAAGGDE